MQFAISRTMSSYPRIFQLGNGFVKTIFREAYLSRTRMRNVSPAVNLGLNTKAGFRAQLALNPLMNYSSTKHAAIIASPMDRYKEVGRKELEDATLAQTQHRVNKFSLLNQEDNSKPSVKQLKLAALVEDIMGDIIEDLLEAGDTTLTIGPEKDPIEWVAVEVSVDCKHARVHWTLPASLVGMWPRDMVMKATQHISAILQTRSRAIQHMLTMRINRARAPRIHFVACSTDVSHSKEAAIQRKHLGRYLRMQDERNREESEL